MLASHKIAKTLLRLKMERRLRHVVVLSHAHVIPAMDRGVVQKLVAALLQERLYFLLFHILLFLLFNGVVQGQGLARYGRQIIVDLYVDDRVVLLVVVLAVVKLEDFAVGLVLILVL